MVKQTLILILIFSLIACSNDDVNSNPEVVGNASAIKNGVEWSADVNYFVENIPFNIGFDMGFIKYSSEGYPRENLSFYRFLNNFELQTIYLTNSQIENDSIGVFYTTLIDDGDVLGDIYELDTTAINNFIQITNYNSSKKEIEGNFNVSLILTRDDGHGEVPPQHIVFSEGKFTVKVKPEWFEQ